MTRLVVWPAERPLVGSVPVPSDKSIGHRALIFASLARGRSEIRGFSYGEDNVATERAFAAMGAEFEDDGEGTLRCTGVGLGGLRQPAAPMDCGNSGTTMRLLAGVLAGQPFASRLVGDASLTRRPMGRVLEPLRARGAVASGAPHPARAGDETAPLEIGPLSAGRALSALTWEQTIASAQVKSAILLSGLFADGPTIVREPMISRDHTERMMRALGYPIEAAGTAVALTPPQRDAGGFAIDVPGDLSAAAFLLVAGLLVEGSTVTTRDVGINPTRRGAIDAIQLFGGTVRVEPHGDALGEPVGEITVAHGALQGCGVSGEVALRGLDEIPILCALAARAKGTTRFDDVGELRVKESDRIRAMVDVLTRFGIEAEAHETGLTIAGRPSGRLRACRVSSHGDHRVAMTAAVLGLVAEGETIVDDAEPIATSFPKFVGTLRALGARVEAQS